MTLESQMSVCLSPKPLSLSKLCLSNTLMDTKLYGAADYSCSWSSEGSWHEEIFSVVKVTLESQMSVHGLSFYQNPSASQNCVNQPPCQFTIIPINQGKCTRNSTCIKSASQNCVYQPSCLFIVMPIDHCAYQTSCLTVIWSASWTSKPFLLVVIQTNNVCFKGKLFKWWCVKCDLNNTFFWRKDFEETSKQIPHIVTFNFRKETIEWKLNMLDCNLFLQ